MGTSLFAIRTINKGYVRCVTYGSIYTTDNLREAITFYSLDAVINYVTKNNKITTNLGNFGVLECDFNFTSVASYLFKFEDGKVTTVKIGDAAIKVESIIKKDTPELTGDQIDKLASARDILFESGPEDSESEIKYAIKVYDSETKENDINEYYLGIDVDTHKGLLTTTNLKEAEMFTGIPEAFSKYTYLVGKFNKNAFVIEKVTIVTKSSGTTVTYVERLIDDESRPETTSGLSANTVYIVCKDDEAYVEPIDENHTGPKFVPNIKDGKRFTSFDAAKTIRDVLIDSYKDSTFTIMEYEEIFVLRNIH